MGMLVEGKWVDRWYDTKASGGKFVRQDAKWRDWVTADGKPAEGRERGFKAEPGRYHLYVSLACPWAHRTLIFRKLKKTGGHHLGLDRAPLHGQGRLDVPRRRRRDGRHALRPRFPAPDLHQGRSRLYGSRHCAGAVGQTRRDDRLQRVVRDHPHAELGLRRMGRRLARLLSRKPCAARSTASTRWFTRRSTTAFIAPASRRRRKPMRRRSGSFSPRSTNRKAAIGPALSGRATASPRPTGGCSPRSPASTRSMSDTSNAI